MPYDPQRHGPRRVVGPGFHARVYAVVDRIPPGFVATYGDVAAALGLRAAARQVGFALASLPPGRATPWHRVVNRVGALTSPDAERQSARLRAEGIAVEDGRVVGLAAVRVPPEALEADDTDLD